jgi:hypothetical protein
MASTRTWSSQFGYGMQALRPPNLIDRHTLGIRSCTLEQSARLAVHQRADADQFINSRRAVEEGGVFAAQCHKN